MSVFDVGNEHYINSTLVLGIFSLSGTKVQERKRELKKANKLLDVSGSHASLSLILLTTGEGVISCLPSDVLASNFVPDPYPKILKDFLLHLSSK